MSESSPELPVEFPPLSLPVRMRLPLPGLRMSERKLLLVVGDVLLLNAALILSLLLRTDLLPHPVTLFPAYKWFLTLTAVWGIMATIFDVYNLARAASTTYSVRAVLGASAFAGILYLFIPWLTPPLQNRSQAFLFVSLAILFVVAWRGCYALVFVQPVFQRRTLVIGAGDSGRILAQALQSDFARRDANPFRGTGYVLVGFIDDDPACRAEMIDGVPVLGDSRHLVRLARTLGIDEVVVAITRAEQIRAELFEAILDCRELGIPVVNISTVYERLTGRVAVAFAGSVLEMVSQLDDSLGDNSGDRPFARLYGLTKRIIDIGGALLGSAALLLLMPLVAVGNAISSPGPLFFYQQRVGRGGQPFTLIKFRSMVPEAEKGSGAVWAQRHDGRVTPVGRWLRRTHLDELPQVLNVWRGEMSLVGPRPERPEFVGQLSRQLPLYRARHCLRPGITGWAQIHYDYGDSVDSAREKLEFDLYYVKHATPLLDILIILRTFSRVLGLRGR